MRVPFRPEKAASEDRAAVIAVWGIGGAQYSSARMRVRTRVVLVGSAGSSDPNSKERS